MEECWKLIDSVIVEGKETFIPSKCFSGTNSGLKKTVPKTVLDKIRIKRKAFKTDQNYRTKENYNAYVRTRNQVKWIMKNLLSGKKLFWQKTLKMTPRAFLLFFKNQSQREHC